MHHEKCLYNIDPLKTHFYIVKLGFTGVYIIFLISAQIIDCGYLLEPPRGSKMKVNFNLDDTLLVIFPEYSKSDVLDTHKSMVKKVGHLS